MSPLARWTMLLLGFTLGATIAIVMSLPAVAS